MNSYMTVKGQIVIPAKIRRNSRNDFTGSLPLPDCLAGMEEDLKKGFVPLQVFNNREIYELELRRIFAKSWVFIGHESELPNPGDYALRYIGEDPFIFVRDGEGMLRVLFNGCRHRGSQIVRVEMGNTTHFTCPYHGWTYRNDGRLEGVPVKSQGYRELNLADWSLFPAAHVANYCGLIFANLDPDATPFDEYMGEYRWYLDIQFKLTDGGMEVLGEPHRMLVEANWKQGAENNCGDSSHTHMAHRSALESGVVVRAAAAGAPGRFGLHVHDIDGHAVSIRLAEPGQTAFWEYPEEVRRLFSAKHLNEAQFDLARRAIVHDGTFFPNFSFVHFGLTDSADRPAAGFLSIHLWQPRGPGRMEIWNWVLAPKEASESYKRRAYQVGLSFSPSGSFEQDDLTVWRGIARTASTVFAEVNHVKLNYQMGMAGMADYVPIPDFPGPGTATPSNAGEGGLRTFHKTWYKKMTGGWK